MENRHKSLLLEWHIGISSKDGGSSLEYSPCFLVISINERDTTENPSGTQEHIFIWLHHYGNFDHQLLITSSIFT